MKSATRYASISVAALLTLYLSLGVGSVQAQESLYVDDNGNVGVGTTTPASSLHVYGNDGSTTLRLEEVSGTVAPRVLFYSVNNGPVLLQMANAARSEIWQYGENSAGKFVMREVIVGSTPDELTIDSAGNMTLTGTLTITGGCTGCDAVFQPDWPLESIEEHATTMWDRGHLPAVGPTSEGEVAIDVFQKMTGMLQELEKAHIYIEQLHGEVQELEVENARIRTDLEGRLARLEALLVGGER